MAIAAGSGLVALAGDSIPSGAGGARHGRGSRARRRVHILYFVFLAGAYRWGDLSYSYPIMRGGGPLIVAIAGIFFFKEMPSSKGGHRHRPDLRRHPRFRARYSRPGRATWFAVGNAGVIAAYTIIDAQGARASGAPVAYTAWFFVANGVVITAMGLMQRWAPHCRRTFGATGCAPSAAVPVRSAPTPSRSGQ